MRSKRSVGIGIVLGSAAVLSAAGCSGSVSVGGTGIDQQKLQDEITSQVKTVVPSVDNVTVTCPPDIPLAKDTNFTCTAAIGDQQLKVKVTQTDDQGNVEYLQEQALLDLDKLETTLDPQLVEQLGGQWKTVCEPVGRSRYYALEPGKDFECYTTGRSGDGRDAKDMPLIVTVKNIDGEVTWTTK